MKQLTRYQLNKVSNNLDTHFNRATIEDTNNGLDWYNLANVEVSKIASKFDIQPYLVAGVLSALSPRNKWGKNIIDTYTVCEAFKNGVQPDTIKVSTFHCNKYKAFNILKGSVEITDKSLKTFNFIKNVGLLCEDSLTVDVWHLRACFNKTIGACGRLAYEQLKEITLKKAKEQNITGYQYQAIIWNSIRRTFEY